VSGGILEVAEATIGLINAASFTVQNAGGVEVGERDRIRERVGQVKADQRARGRYLGGIVPFGFRVEGGELVRHEGEQRAIGEMVALRAEGRPLRAIRDAVRAKGVRISHTGVANVLRADGAVV
jgi:putative DNA-invertase from lambdoid prophage Rac